MFYYVAVAYSSHACEDWSNPILIQSVPSLTRPSEPSQEIWKVGRREFVQVWCCHPPLVERGILLVFPETWRWLDLYKLYNLSPLKGTDLRLYWVSSTVIGHEGSVVLPRTADKPVLVCAWCQLPFQQWVYLWRDGVGNLEGLRGFAALFFFWCSCGGQALVCGGKCTAAACGPPHQWLLLSTH